MDNNDIGSKIKYFRKRAGLSQLELEIETDSSAGSICRIEAGKVNPTKEKLSQIINSLKLTDYEVCLLLGIKFSNQFILKLEKLVHSIVEEIELTDLEKLSICNIFIELLSKIEFDGLSFSKYENNTIQLKHIVSDTVGDFMNKILINHLHYRKIDLNNEKITLTSRSIIENRPFVSDKLSDFICPPLNMTAANMIQRISKLERMASIPIKFKVKNKEILGVLNFCPKYDYDINL